MKKDSKQMTISGQSLLEKNIEKSKKLIKKYNKNNKLLVGFSGGKDSMVLLDLVINTIPKKDVYVVFENTKIEFKETLEFVDYAINEYFDILDDHYFETKPTRNFWEILNMRKNKLKWVALWRDCCYTLKKIPLNRVLHDNNFDYALSGVRNAESKQRSGFGFKAHMYSEGKIDYELINPLIRWTDENIWNYIDCKGLPLCKIYDMGYERLGCAVCPCPNKAWDYYSKLRETHPKWYNVIFNKADDANEGEKFYRHTWKEVEV